MTMLCQRYDGFYRLAKLLEMSGLMPRRTIHRCSMLSGVDDGVMR
jgi:hypothetical protein